MLAFNVVVFDSDISGTTSTWYSADQFNDQLGSADSLCVLASWGRVSDSSATVTVAFEHCADGQHWLPVTGTGAPPIDGVNMTSLSAIDGYAPGLTPLFLSFVRLKVTLGGSSTAACRLKLTVTGRRY